MAFNVNINKNNSASFGAKAEAVTTKKMSDDQTFQLRLLTGLKEDQVRRIVDVFAQSKGVSQADGAQKLQEMFAPKIAASNGAIQENSPKEEKKSGWGFRNGWFGGAKGKGGAKRAAKGADAGQKSNAPQLGGPTKYGVSVRFWNLLKDKVGNQEIPMAVASEMLSMLGVDKGPINRFLAICQRKIEMEQKGKGCKFA